MITCPNCGCRHDGAPAFDIGAVKLTRLQRALVLRLLQAKGGVVRHDQMIDHLYGHRSDGGPEDALNCLRTHTAHARRRLQPIGWTIKTEWGQGYRLERWEA